jgi:hypothetical protein
MSVLGEHQPIMHRGLEADLSVQDNKKSRIFLRPKRSSGMENNVHSNGSGPAENNWF